MRHAAIWIGLGLALLNARGEASAVSKCAVGRICSVRGVLVATHRTGAIRDDSGCIAVALPAFVPDGWNGRTVKASGLVYRAVDLPGLVTYKLKDRMVDAEACYSGRVLFVDRIETAKSALKAPQP